MNFNNLIYINSKRFPSSMLVISVLVIHFILRIPCLIRVNTFVLSNLKSIHLLSDIFGVETEVETWLIEV